MQVTRLSENQTRGFLSPPHERFSYFSCIEYPKFGNNIEWNHYSIKHNYLNSYLFSQKFLYWDFGFYPLLDKIAPYLEKGK